jgi:N-acetylmuramoyl-L-alanine amidase
MRLALFLVLLSALAACLFRAVPAGAAIEVRRGDQPPTIIADVYQRDGVAFVAIDEVLSVFGLSGRWDNVAHIYSIETAQGPAVISPGSRYLRYGGQTVTVTHRPRFIDGKLRVSEPFLVEQLAPLLRLPLQLRNLAPAPPPPPPESPLDQFFSLLLQQRPKAAADSQWIVAIDPGHGGQDAGAIGMGGSTERAVNLAVAQQLHKLLKMHRDAPVIMTRDADYAVDALQRHEAVARGQADVLLSLHAQASLSPAAQGIMLFVAPELAAGEGAGSGQAQLQGGAPGVNASRQLAETLRTALLAAGLQVAPIQERALLPLGQGNLPRVLIEMGYLTSQDDLTRLRAPAGQAQLAQALFNGLETFLSSYQEL